MNKIFYISMSLLIMLFSFFIVNTSYLHELFDPMFLVSIIMVILILVILLAIYLNFKKNTLISVSLVIVLVPIIFVAFYLILISFSAIRW